jgi:hypothetical protein
MAKVRKDAAAALHDEQVTRKRVAEAEKAIVALVNYAEKTELLAQDLADWRARSFLGRLRWLLTGN